MLKSASIVLLLCATLQINAQRFDYLECLRNPKAHTARYDRELKHYIDYATPFHDQKVRDIDQMLETMAKSKKCLNAYNQRRAVYYANLGFNICGGIQIFGRYNGPWIQWPNLSDQQICQFVATKGPVLEKLIKNNMPIVPRCPSQQYFRDIYYKQWQECVSHDRQ